jgi:tetratricopeptide (TPR) repeat protein
VTLLEAELERAPDNARAAYYLGMTYSWLGRWDEAARALDRRIAMGGWVEEIYQAHMQRALVDAHRGRPWSELLERYLAAHGLAPHRAEPLHAIAAHYDGVGEHALCFLFARRGWELPFPQGDSLFVDDSVYAWRLADLVASSAYWIGELTLGEQAARQALRHHPDDARLRDNLEFYLKRKRRSGRRKGRRH